MIEPGHPWLGIIADDFTGACDAASAVAGEGHDARLQFGTSSLATGSEGLGGDCSVVALKSRSIPKDLAIDATRSAANWLLGRQPIQLYFKYCSTFDSTDAGNIGPVAMDLAALLDFEGPVVFCPASPRNGRTVYQGHLFVGNRLLSESSMRAHPLTPMVDPDVVRVLQRQVDWPVVSLARESLRNGPGSLRERLARDSYHGTAIIADAVDESDLDLLAEAVSDFPLVSGGAGLIGAIARRRRYFVKAKSREEELYPTGGSSVILAGSTSVATLAQVDHYLSTGAPGMRVDVDAIGSGQSVTETLVRFIVANRDRNPIVYSGTNADDVLNASARWGPSLAHEIEQVLAAVACAVVGAGVRQIIVAGGETSGAVTEALGVEMLRVGPDVAPGVPVGVATRPVEIALVLKSGGFGGDSFFNDAVALLGARRGEN